MTHCALNAGPSARSLVYTRRQSIAGEIVFKFGGVTMFRVFPYFLYSRTQNSCVFGFPSGTGASNMASSFELVVGQNNFLQSSENCHPKLILALEVVVGEEKCSFCFEALE